MLKNKILVASILSALFVSSNVGPVNALELDEEDLALVTFACPAKYEYGIWEHFG